MAERPRELGDFKKVRVNAVFEWDRNAPERRSGSFKTARLMVKLH